MAWGRHRCNVVKDQRFIARIAVQFGSLVAAQHGSTSTTRADAGHACALSGSCRFGARARPGGAEAQVFWSQARDAIRSSDLSDR